jgi:predicted ATPase
MSSAHGGQVVLSPSTVALLEPDSVQLKELGRHRLKDLSNPIPLHQLLVDGLPREFPRLRTLYHSTLPVPATAFLGREAELAEVTQRLTDPDTRLLTLTGPGGTGKTRLALQAAAEVSESFPDGVWWVPLAPLRDPALALATVAQAVQVSAQPGTGLADALAQALLGRRTLLVLDNAEHLLPDLARELAALLAQCPTLRLLVTSRERLQLQAEQVYAVPSLASDEAVGLFLARAAASGAHVVADDDVRELCARLDDLPLAIELAAARTRSLSVPAILERLDEQLGLLATRARDVDERQRTLRSTIEWSYDLLDGEEQRALRALSVFAGGCTLEAAEHVAGAGFTVLEALLDKSLLRHRFADGDRYWMLETIREYAAELRVSAGEDEAVRSAHADWYCVLASPPDGHIWSASLERRDVLETELDNFRVAHQWLVEREDTKRALGLASDLFALWEMSDRIVEGARWLDLSLDLPEVEPTLVRAHCLSGRAVLGYLLGELDDAQRLAYAGVELMREIGSDEQVAQVLLAAAWVPRHRDEARARELLEEALAIARRAGSTYILRSTLHHLGELERNAGAYDAGARHFTEALRLARELGDPAWIGAIGHSFADLELYRGRDAVARDLYLGAAHVSVAGRFPSQVALCAGGLAAIAARRGETDLARRLWAAVEHWERERGVQLPWFERSRYEAEIGDLPPDDRPPLTLDEAIALASAAES